MFKDEMSTEKYEAFLAQLEEVKSTKKPEAGTMVNTIHGLMDVALLEHRVKFFEDENEFTRNVQYWLNDELVHDSPHVHLKKNVVSTAHLAE
jgi:hypothetical protein